MKFLMTVRIWIDAELVLKEQMPADPTEEEAQPYIERHTDLAALADREGKKFLMEWELPWLPEDERYMRWGTDPEGMVDPIAIRVDE